MHSPAVLYIWSHALCDIAGLCEVLRKHTFVGMADETLALLQHGTRLYLLNVANLSKDMFYQQVYYLVCTFQELLDMTRLLPV